MTKRMFIKIQTQFEAVHRYPAAPSGVRHLRYPHRHTFITTVTIEVKHEDRELEFYKVKDFLDDKVQQHLGVQLKNKSCEMLNDFFYKHLIEKYGQRCMEIETSEDGQRSAITHYGVDNETQV